MLNTEHFILRPLRPEDEHEIFILRSDEGVNRYLDRQPAASIEDARAFIQKIMEITARGESEFWVICTKSGTRLMGTICFWNFNDDRTSAEIGYEVLPEHQGKGIMREVIPVVIGYGFDVLGLGRVTAGLSRDNVRSLRLLERNGFELVGEEDGMVEYELVRRQRPIA